jgi:DNA mismatch repair protein MutS
MGARLLKNWLVLPLKSVEEIEKRQEIVQYFYENEEITENITRPLKNIGDLERLISKVSAGRINPREMNQLRRALQNIIPIKELLNDKIFENYKFDLCTELLTKIDAELLDEVPLVANQGNLIRENVHAELDELRRISGSGKDYLEKIQQQEAMRTGIPSLKISYNKVFGYYLEVRNLHKDKVPKEWIRKQTLSGAERYITEELKVYEEKILTAEDKITAIEQQLFWAMVEKAKEFVAPIQRNAKIIARIDCMSGFAAVARKNNYAKPILNDSKIIDIRDGRHPVIEKQLAIGEDYVPNDVFLDDETQQIMIITGPNMAGKSALLRQTALIVLMAQMGSFVPASSANIGLVDKVFTRVGASDNLSKGESTFMVEMTETASILNNLSDRSLVLMDEIGRGTSTYDGISIAWAIVEYLHNHPKFAAKTLFATHYHELNELAEDMQRVKNYNVSVRELNNKVVFMRKLKAGGSEHSFGIHVAQMAGMPNQIVIRANEIMEHLEQNKAEDLNVNTTLNTSLELPKTAKEQMKIKVKEIPKAYQMTLFESKDPNYEKIKEMLKVLDINTISPVEALLKLNEIKGLMK